MNVKSGKANFNKVLSLVSDTQYILPKHYNMDFTMTRYFRYEYMSVEEFLSINDLNVVLDDKQVCDGKVLALYSIDDIDRRLPRECARHLSLPYARILGGRYRR